MQFAIAVALIAASPFALQAQSPGLVAPQARASSAVTAKKLTASVTIVDGVATTRLKLTVANSGAQPAEADWILPLPPGSVADEFRMTMDGKLTSGEVLASDRARGVYEGIVRARRDPGLLEYVGRGCLRARIFPIPSRGSLEVEVGYREVLPLVGGMLRWSFPLAAAGLDARAPEQVVLDLQLDSQHTLHNVFSPTPGVHVVVERDHRARASYEGPGAGVADGELSVIYALADGQFGLDLLSTRAKGEAEGTFLMLISPKRELVQQTVSKREVVFALDTSGSMAGKKLLQARGALRFFLHSLAAQDRFNVVPFSTEAAPFFDAPVAADAENIERALDRAERLQAQGGTNIEDALRASLTARAGGEGVPIVVLLTDGLPTVEVTDETRILADARTWNTHGARIFVFGVGDDVNTLLLDTLADDSGATRCYVRPSEDIELATSDLFAKLSHPVLTDLELEVEGVVLERVVPRKLPDLFHGGRLLVAGRYRGAGPGRVVLRGQVAGVRREFVYPAQFAAAPVASLDFVPTLWAERRVAMLLDQIRLHGAAAELVEEVRQLGVEHRIVTPYTSHLIVEEGLALAPGNAGPRTAGGAPSGGGGPASPGAGGPASPGPATPGSAAPGPRTQGPASPGGSWRGPTSGLPGDSVLPAPDLAAITRQLIDAGVLPAGAPPEDARTLALEIVKELRAADDALRGLGKSNGSAAVDDSVYLARLVAAGGVSSDSDAFYLGRGEQGARADLLALFTRRIKDKVFVLRRGVWTDRTPIAADAARTLVEAFSDEWFGLLKDHPELAPYLAFSVRLRVVLDGRVYEVRAPASAPKED